MLDSVPIERADRQGWPTGGAVAQPDAQHVGVDRQRNVRAAHRAGYRYTMITNHVLSGRVHVGVHRFGKLSGRLEAGRRLGLREPASPAGVLAVQMRIGEPAVVV